jgi:hypothetical protein
VRRRRPLDASPELTVVRRALAGLVALLVPLLVVPATAAQPTLHHPGQRVTWQGTLTVPDPAGCGDVTSHGCVHHELVVDAASGTWITVGADEGTYVRVTQAGNYVASNGFVNNTREVGSATSQVTFQQLRSARVVYDVGVSSEVADPLQGSPFHATATLAGRAFDRSGECFVGDSGVGALLAPDDGRQLRLSVRLVGDPKDAAVIRRAGTALVEIYGRIGITVRVSYDFLHLRTPAATEYPFDQVRKRYGGMRPPGVDAVHVITDLFSGGFADCIGGVAYRERGFSTGNAHYNTSGLTMVGTTVDVVPAGLIAAHEIGHELGGQHQMVSCVEALPQQAARPASDGWTGACTEMGPAALQDSETWSTVERASVRSYVRRYAGR